jgi:hypothetical protein
MNTISAADDNMKLLLQILLLPFILAVYFVSMDYEYRHRRR